MYRVMSFAFWYLMVPVFAGVMAYVATAAALHGPPDLMPTSPPAIDFSEELVLGEHEAGDIAVARYTIANVGGQPLRIDHIHSNCSCTGIEIEKRGKYYRPESLVIEPGEKKALVTRFTVLPGAVGSQMRNSISFRTNDPNRPSCQIAFVICRVRGGLHLSSNEVGFGSVLVGQAVQYRIEVWDAAKEPRSLQWVRSSDPERVSAHFVPSNNGEQVIRDGLELTQLGHVLIRVSTSDPGDVDAVVQLAAAGREQKPDRIRVFGMVRAPIEITPSSLLLPRMSLDGPVYTARCIVRSIKRERLSLRIEETPAWLRVEKLDLGGPTVRLLQVTLDPDLMPTASTPEAISIRLQASAGSDDVPLTLPVHIMPKRGEP